MADGNSIVQKIRDLAAAKIANGEAKVNVDLNQADFLDYSAQCLASDILHNRNWAMRSAFECVMKAERRMAELSQPDIQQYIVQEKEGYPTHFQPQSLLSKERYDKLVETKQRHEKMLAAIAKMVDDPSEANVKELKELTQDTHRYLGY